MYRKPYSQTKASKISYVTINYDIKYHMRLGE